MVLKVWGGEECVAIDHCPLTILVAALYCRVWHLLTIDMIYSSSTGSRGGEVINPHFIFYFH